MPLKRTIPKVLAFREVASQADRQRDEMAAGTASCVYPADEASASGATIPLFLLEFQPCCSSIHSQRNFASVQFFSHRAGVSVLIP
jgi:hypothetical protein